MHSMKLCEKNYTEVHREYTEFHREKNLMMNRIKYIFFLSIITLSSFAQKATIKGTAKTYEYKEISVWLNNDPISGTQKQIALSEVDSLGNFSLEFKIDQTEYITLKIEKNITSLPVEPNANYEVILFPPDSTTYQNPNLEHDVKLSIKLKSKTEINALTLDYDKRFDDFLSLNYKSFVARIPQNNIDSFKVEMKEFYSTVKNNYFSAYVTYSIAALEEKTKMPEKLLFEKYILNKPILYHHPEYMNFFNALYKGKMENMAAGKFGHDLFFQINDRGSFDGTMNILKQDPYLKNDTLTELVLLKGLYEGFYNGSFKKTSVEAILRQLNEETNVEEHTRISQNILNSFSKLQKGTEAPNFELPDKTGALHTLNELSAKKYVYLMFYDVNCSACLQQMKVIASFKKTYGERIEFVSISTDKTISDMKNFQLKNPKYDWLFLYDNSAGELKKKYEIRSLPAYFLIGMQGRFIEVPADSPDEDIERVFYDLTRLKSKLHNIGSKENH